MITALEGVRGQRHDPAAVYPREKPGTHGTGGWVGPRAGLDRYGKSRRHRDSIPDFPAGSQSLYRLSYRAHKFCTVYSQSAFQSRSLQIIQVRATFPPLAFTFTCNVATATWFVPFTFLKLKAGRSRVRFPMVSLEFFIDIILPAALWPWGWLSL